ncbi:MAG TPA: PAS domain-containing protein [Herpetosiphonaceae bacterium]|nr:PAS domain-containing protein [Herpetosiphonaceae bacterium]
MPDSSASPPPSPAAPDPAARLAQLEAQVGLFSSILDEIEDMVLYKGPGSHILYANRAFREYYGMSMDELQGLIDAPFNEPDNTLQYIRDDQHVFSTGQRLDITEPVTRFDGKVEMFNTFKVPIRDQAGMIVGTLGISRNVSEHQAILNTLQATEERLARITANVPGMVYQFVLTADGKTSFPYVSGGSRDIYGIEPEVIMRDGNAIISLTHPDDRESFNNSVAQSAATLGPWEWEGRAVVGGKVKYLQGLSRPVRLPNGDTLWDGLLVDVTARRLSEAEQLRLQQEVINLQATALAELSTPLIQLNQATILMPLIGTIDSQRAAGVITSLLDGVGDYKARVAILDLTGVPVVDTQVASALIRAAQAVRLLGAQVILTGIRPEIAQTLVALGVDLGEVVTRSNLQMGIEYALAQAQAGDQRLIRR